MNKFVNCPIHKKSLPVEKSADGKTWLATCKCDPGSKHFGKVVWIHVREDDEPAIIMPPKKSTSKRSKKWPKLPASS